MSDRIQRIATDYLDRLAAGEKLDLDEWCAQHGDDSEGVRTAILEREAAEATAASVGSQTEDFEYEEKLDLDVTENELFDGRYRILKVLGEGGFGKVYLVEDTFQDNQRLALKLIKTEHQNAETFVKRFQLEIRVLRALQHAGIPPIYNDGVTSDGEVYFTMEFVKGESLEEILKKKCPQDPENVAIYVSQIVRILDYAHQQGVIHRDLKPGNVMITNPGTPEAVVRVLDFGIAKVLKKDGAFAQMATMQTQMPLGTPHFMAPEQVRGLEIDGKTDLYALGIMIYRMVSGKYPFAGKTSMEIMAARLQDRPSPLPKETQPVWAAALVKELLATEQEKRPGTKQIQELLDTGKAIKKGQDGIRNVLVTLTCMLIAVGAYSFFSKGEEKVELSGDPGQNEEVGKVETQGQGAGSTGGTKDKESEGSSNAESVIPDQKNIEGPVPRFRGSAFASRSGRKKVLPIGPGEPRGTVWTYRGEAGGDPGYACDCGAPG